VNLYEFSEEVRIMGSLSQNGKAEGENGRTSDLMLAFLTLIQLVASDYYDSDVTLIKLKACRHIFLTLTRCNQ
jgi:hypothetical protein